MAEMQIPVVKAKADIAVDLDKLPDEMVQEIWFLGLKAMLNRGMTEVTGTDTPQKRKDAMDAAAANLERLYEGKMRRTSGQKSAKGQGEVMTEARRLAKIEVKAALKEAGHKVSYIPASEITRLANEYLATDDGKEVIALAKEAVEKRNAKKGERKIKVDSVKEDPKLVAKGEAQKASRKKATAEKKGKTPPPAKQTAQGTAARH
jgi:acetylornithine deacetylase/succinyl-diaminopimelate desuccinylase-like protein